MIIVKDYMILEDGTELVRTYSDADVMIEQDGTGARYAEAIDVKGRYTYTETDEPIGTEEIDDAEALSIILGGAE